MFSDDVAIRTDRLAKCYTIYEHPRDRLKQFIFPRIQRLLGRVERDYFRAFWALKNVSFEIKRGETVGIIGRNGSGKSTLLQIICGTLSPTAGDVEVRGRIAALLELGSGFNPEFTGRENVYLNASVLGLTKAETDARFEDIVSFADIGDFIDQPVKTYSSGMVVRLAFGVMVHVKPQILVIDEALAVGDAAFQRKCMRKIEELVASGVTLLFVSHDTETVKKICSRAIYLSQGVVRAFGDAKDICLVYEKELFGTSRVEEEVADKASIPTEIAASSFLDPELQRNSEKVYGDGRTSIENIEISSHEGEIINVISAGSKFIVSYNVIFLGAVSNPIFGMMLTDREGVCVFGVNSSGTRLSRHTYNENDLVNVRFELTNNLGPGVYYLTCGIHAPDADRGLIYTQRRVDNQILRSVGRGAETVSGYSHLYPEIQVSHLPSVKSRAWS